MKLKVLIAALFVAGFASSFALAGGTKGAVGTTTGTTATTATTGTTASTSTSTTTTGTTTTPTTTKCQKLELKGSNGAGTVTFTVDKAGKKSSDLAGKPVTLAIPAGSRVQAQACRDAAGVLTLRALEVSAQKSENQNNNDGEHGDNNKKDNQKGD